MHRYKKTVFGHLNQVYNKLEMIFILQLYYYTYVYIVHIHHDLSLKFLKSFFFTLLANQLACCSQCFLGISLTTSWEDFLKYQDILHLMIISFFSHEWFAWSNSDTVRRSWMIVTVGTQRVEGIQHKFSCIFLFYFF